MSPDQPDDRTVYKVVVNHEEQYSIWPSDQDSPAGWKEAGKEGSKKECLEYIEDVWTDLRPLSLRKHMEEAARQPAPARETEPAEPARDDLVDRLCEGQHPIEAGLPPHATAQSLKQAIDRDSVHVRFTDTKGGTELGLRLDRDASDWSAADFERPDGRVRLVGELTLNYEKVRCVADIDLQSLAGTGHLERMA